MFECIEIAESIYEGIVDPSYKRPTRLDSNFSGHTGKMIVKCTSSNTYS